MSVLLESPVAVAALGLLVVTMGAIPYTQTRSRGAFVGLLVAVVLAVGGLAFERLVQTPREQVQQTLAGLFTDIEANDLQGVLMRIDPSATDVRADAETLMPMFRVEAASEGGQVDIEVAGDKATATLKPLIRVQHRKSGAVGAYFDGLAVDLVRRDERWLVEAYSPAQDWRDGAAQLSR